MRHTQSGVLLASKPNTAHTMPKVKLKSCRKCKKSRGVCVRRGEEGHLPMRSAPLMTCRSCRLAAGVCLKRGQQHHLPTLPTDLQTCIVCQESKPHRGDVWCRGWHRLCFECRLRWEEGYTSTPHFVEAKRLENDLPRNPPCPVCRELLPLTPERLKKGKVSGGD